MTKMISMEAGKAEQVLEALSDFDYDKRMKAITAMREALAEQTPKKFDPNESFRKEEANLARVREFMRRH